MSLSHGRGPSGSGFHLSTSTKNNSEKICPLEKWWPGKKVPGPKLLVIFLCPSKSIKPSITKQNNTNPRLWGKLEVLKNIFLFYRNCQKRANLVHQKMWDRLKQNSLGSTALGVPLAASSNLPRSLGRTGFHISSNLPLKEGTNPKMANHQQFSSVFHQYFKTLLVTPNKNQELSKFRPAWICLVSWKKWKYSSTKRCFFLNGDLASHGRSNPSKTSALKNKHQINTDKHPRNKLQTPDLQISDWAWDLIRTPRKFNRLKPLEKWCLEDDNFSFWVLVYLQGLC